MPATKPASAQPALPHRLTLDECAHLEVTGVTEILRFDAEAVVLRTVRGTLLLQGDALKLKTLVPESGRVVVDGKLCSAAYADAPARGGLLRRLFG